jgi:integrase
LKERAVTATRRRGHGEGSIYKRASDGLWVGVVDLGWQQGKRSRKTVYGKTRAEVVTKLRKVQRDVEQGLPVIDERRTTGDYMTWWAESVLPGTVKPSTADDYRWIIEKYIVPHIGKIQLAKLQPNHVQSMLRALERQGLSPRTRRYARAVLRRALGHAERWGLVGRNVAALVEVPRLDGTKLDDALSVAEAHALLDAARGDRLEVLVTVALALGLRKGEALALRWKDVDLDRGTLTVSGTLKRRVGEGLFIDIPKTDNARRTIALPGSCVRALREHKRRQTAEKLACGPAWQAGDFVFTTPIGTPIDPRNCTRLYHALTERAGLGRGRFHALRHSAATIMLGMGVPLEVISKTLGHAGYAITADVYAHVRADLQRRAADAMDQLFCTSSDALPTEQKPA